MKKLFGPIAIFLFLCISVLSLSFSFNQKSQLIGKSSSAVTYVYASVTGFSSLPLGTPRSFNLLGSGDLSITRLTSTSGTGISASSSNLTFSAVSPLNPAFIAGTRSFYNVLFSNAVSNTGTISYEFNFLGGLTTLSYLIFCDMDFGQEVGIKAYDMNGNLIPYSEFTFSKHNGNDPNGSTLNYIAFTDVNPVDYSGKLSNILQGNLQNPVVTLRSSVKIRKLIYEFNMNPTGTIIGNSLGFNFASPSGQSIKYVKHNAAGNNDGSSWANAFTTLQTGLDAAGFNEQVWVAAGTYYPETKIGGASERYRAFQLNNYISVYGGFSGTETALSERTNYGHGQANETILSGDIGNPGITADNCYHVFYHPDGLNLNNTAVLDGFTITGGNADGSLSDAYGGAVHNYFSSPVLRNIYITGNNAVFGGGVYNYYSSSVFANVSLIGNNSALYGGGMFNSDCSNALTIVNTLFANNSASNGAGICNDYSSPAFTNVTIANNNSSVNGGGVYSINGSYDIYRNCIIWGNNSVYEGKQFFIFDGTVTLSYSSYSNSADDIAVSDGSFSAADNNITSNPVFVNPASDFRISGISPCADLGLDSYNSETQDVRGVSRKLDKITGLAGTIDMGAYEYKVSDDPLPVVLSSFSFSVQSGNVLLSWITESEENNSGFDIEKSEIINNAQNAWKKVGFVAGSGNISTPVSYHFEDKNLNTGKYKYRLKQIDFNGNHNYHNLGPVVEIGTPGSFMLSQNYPNPFNPVTKIHFSLPVESKVNLIIYDLSGREVARLINDKFLKADYYSVEFNATALASGVYFYTLSAGNFRLTKKMMLIK